MRYPTILCDPPWPFSVWAAATGSGRSAESHYKTMSWEDLYLLGRHIDEVAAHDCALLLWACRPSQDRAIMMVNEWNLLLPKKHRWRYKTEAFTWVKTTKAGKPATGMGYWTRANTEPVLLFTRGDIRRNSRSVPQVIMSPRMAHSAKPEEAQNRIEQLLPGPYLELFARRKRQGWTCLGYEIDGLDIRHALSLEALRKDEQECPISS